jgi:hypothetical protein
MPRFLNQAGGNNLTTKEKVAAIRKYNLELDLPEENPAFTLYNGALFIAEQVIDYKIFHVCKPEFTHPLSAYPQNEQYSHLAKYAGTLSRVNAPQACFVGIPGSTPGLLTVSITTREISKQRFWQEVHRTIFLHQEEPIVSIDIIAESTVLAAPDPDNSLVAPLGIFYNLPLDIRDSA